MKLPLFSTRKSKKLQSLYFFLLVFFCSLLLHPVNVFSCSLPTDSIQSETELFPQQVRDTYCNLEDGFQPFLLIRAAVNEALPIFRIIAVAKDERNVVQKVRLYQFDKDGCAHKEIKGEPQDIVDFIKETSTFEGRVKCRDTMISFMDQTFCFRMGGIFGLEIEQQLGQNGTLVHGKRDVAALLIKTSKKSNWKWVLADGTLVDF